MPRLCHPHLARDHAADRAGPPWRRPGTGDLALTARPTLLILGLGNSLRGDDGVGLQVVQCLRAQGTPEGVAVEEAGTAGLGILDLICGYQGLVIVDAIDTGAEPGTILELTLDDLATRMPLHTTSTHDINLLAALDLGRRLGLEVPTEIRIVAIQVADTLTLSEDCTPAVQAAVESACLVTARRVAGMLYQGD